MKPHRMRTTIAAVTPAGAKRRFDIPFVLFPAFREPLERLTGKPLDLDNFSMDEIVDASKALSWEQMDDLYNFMRDKMPKSDRYSGNDDYIKSVVVNSMILHWLRLKGVKV